MIKLSCEKLFVRNTWLYITMVSLTSSRVNLHPIFCLNVNKVPARSRCHIWSLGDSDMIRTLNHLVRLTSTQPFSQTGQMIKLFCEYVSVRCIWLKVIIMSRMSFRVNLQSVANLNVKEFIDRSRKEIWSLSGRNEFHIHNHLVHKWTISQLV